MPPELQKPHPWLTSSGQAGKGKTANITINLVYGGGGEVPYPQGGRARSNLHLSQHPNVVDELEGHVHQLLVSSPDIHLPTSYQEHIVGLQLLLDLVWGWEKSVMS